VGASKRVVGANFGIFIVSHLDFDVFCVAELIFSVHFCFWGLVYVFDFPVFFPASSLFAVWSYLNLALAGHVTIRVGG